MRTAPFIHIDNNIAVMDLKTIAALLPCVVYAVFSYGLRALVLTVFTAALWILTETAMKKVTGRGSLRDLSPAVNGIVLAMLLPPGTSLYMAALAVLFGSIVVKGLFGGEGAGFVNPAAAGRLFVEVCFPERMSGFYSVGVKMLAYKSLFDTKVPEETAVAEYSDFRPVELIAGHYPAFIGTGCLIMVITGLVYLIIKRSIRLETPVAFIAIIIIGRLIVDVRTDVYNTFVFIMTSGVVFAAVFIMSDITTTSRRGLNGVLMGMIGGLIAVALSLRGNPAVTLCVPPLAVGLISGFMDFTDSAGRKMRQKGGDADA
ncbi:MAG: RnfABCDGE type electron transport complex subunit D [Clostridiales bacterium]|nr:RnfABCDGE type electron transport complex subunit D [Clostridiales bacterium]